MLLSIILPVYNMEKFLYHCISSIVEQFKSSDVEYLFVNDGSTDSSLDILKKFKEQNINQINITIVNQENSGVSEARNTGIKNASGKYLGFLDPDDILDSKFVIQILNILKLHQPDIIQFEADRFDKDIKKSQKITKQLRDNGLVKLDRKLLKEIYEQTFWVCWTRVFKKELFENLAFPHIPMCEDAAVLPFVFIRAKTMYFHGERLYYYRYNPNSISNLINDRHFKNKESSFLYIHDFFKKESINNIIYLYTLVPILRGYIEFLLKYKGFKSAYYQWDCFRKDIDSLGFKGEELNKISNRLFYQYGVFFLVVLNLIKK